MTIRKLTDTLSVSPQIAAADLPALHAAGIRAIICNRPDGEGPDQPTVRSARPPRRSASTCITCRSIPAR
jgi:sulfide:quinone oxidoreductase